MYANKISCAIMHVVNLKKAGVIMKVDVQGNIINNNIKTLLDGKGILNKELLSWIDNNSIKYLFDFKKTTLIKEDNDTKLELIFIKDEKTKGSVLLKENNVILDITIYTKEYKIEKQNCKIMYWIEEEVDTKNIIELNFTWK